MIRGFSTCCSVVRGKGSEASQTLQMAPLIPPGSIWTNFTDYDVRGLPSGVHYPGGISHLNTMANQWQGIFGRPGNEYQDSLSAISHLNSSFYDSFHTFGVDWEPGKYLRWYVDGIFAYEVNENALKEVTRVDESGQSTQLAMHLVCNRTFMLQHLYHIVPFCVQPLLLEKEPFLLSPCI